MVLTIIVIIIIINHTLESIIFQYFTVQYFLFFLFFGPRDSLKITTTLETCMILCPYPRLPLRFTDYKTDVDI